MSTKGVSQNEALAGISLRAKGAKDAVAHSAAGSWWRRIWYSVTPQMLVGVVTVTGLSLSLLFTVQLALRSQTQLTESARGRLHTLQVEEQIQTMLASIAGAEADLRDYFAGQAEVTLARMREKRTAATTALEALRGLTAGRVERDEHLRRLTELLAARFALMDRLVESARPGSNANLLALMLADRGYESGNALRAETSALLAQVRREDVERQEVLSRQTWGALGWLSVFVGINALAVAGVIAVVFRAGRMSRIATVCAWSHTIEYEGRWMSFEQYLEARFGIKASHGISPEEAAKMMGSMPAAKK
ncbi:MAG: CHASE3 domain-containing protein [Opitutaceae bacterium]|nr:CHASE3 domain-containing protein [Opitutaceae bacterium]